MKLRRTPDGIGKHFVLFFAIFHNHHDDVNPATHSSAKMTRRGDKTKQKQGTQEVSCVCVCFFFFLSFCFFSNYNHNKIEHTQQQQQQQQHTRS
jgi:hypothetical protein